MSVRFQGTHFRNKELRAIYQYLQEDITQEELARRIGKTRTNTYYYIGRAAHYWINTGMLKWRPAIKGTYDLGGRPPKPRKPKVKETSQ